MVTGGGGSEREVGPTEAVEEQLLLSAGGWTLGCLRGCSTKRMTNKLIVDRGRISRAVDRNFKQDE
jgi:hypothetical protein